VSYAPALVVRQLGGMQFVPRTIGIAQFFGLFKDPCASEGYARWRDLAASAR
jgi:hypothetical protein